MSDRDLRLLAHLFAAALLAAMDVLLFAAIIPGLVNLHNDGALILAALLAIGAVVGSVLAAGALRHSFHQGDHE